MGDWPARITSADFVSPFTRGESPEAGRVGGVRLELSATPGGTRLTRAYQQVPVRVLPPFQFGADRPALLYLLNPTAGLFEGDAHLVQLEAGPGTRTFVTSQSATRVHPSLGRFATQQWRIVVRSGAVLVILPGPLIPYQGSRFYQFAEIDLEDGANLIWGDVWFAGRYARAAASEQFRFETLIQDLSIRRQSRLIFRDRFCWNGPWDESTSAWHFGDFPACGSLFVSGPPLPASSAVAPLRCASFATAEGDTCLRWQGPSEDVTAQIVRTALGAAANLVRGPDHSPWLLSAAELAPTHWFSSWG